VYRDFESPRWGIIICVDTIKPVKAGEELFTNYSYKRGGPMLKRV
jgi:hypothetical protein